MTNNKRIIWLGRGIFLIYIILFSRVFFLQVIMGGYYKALSSGNKLKRVVIPAVRGAIIDKDGELVAGNKEEEGRVVRYYPEGEVVGSLSGYVDYKGGVVGLEKEYDKILRGTDGEMLVELDAYGNQVRILGRKEALGGSDIKLYIYGELQELSYLVLKKKLESAGVSGSIVISRVGGEVLSQISLPSYDPNLFTGTKTRGSAGGSYSSVEKVLQDEVRMPLFNRVVSGKYAPGSVYKVVPAIVGLADGVIDKNWLVQDTGEIKVGIYRYGNWYFDQYGGVEGEMNVEKALMRSNDIFFYKLGEKLGIERLVFWSKKIGIGQTTGIDLPGEEAGLMPDPLWRERVTGERWFLGNTYHLSIGQGDLMMTPIQVNRMAASVISGKKCKPMIAVGKRECVDLQIDKASRETVMEGMRKACETGGTAFSFFKMKGGVLCKTGTAQHGGENTKPHAWINVIVPSDKPIEEWVVVTVMIEAGGEGSAEAGPVALQIVESMMKNGI